MSRQLPSWANRIDVSGTGYVVMTTVGETCCIASRGPAQSVQVFDHKRHALDYRDYLRAVAGHPEAVVVKVTYTVATFDAEDV